MKCLFKHIIVPLRFYLRKALEPIIWLAHSILEILYSLLLRLANITQVVKGFTKVVSVAWAAIKRGKSFLDAFGVLLSFGTGC